MLVEGHSVSVVALLVLGTGVGFVAGMFGIGGGFILTPLLTAVLGLPMPIAIGAGLCQMVGTATVALLQHRELGQGERRFDLLALAGSMLGAAAGARAVSVLEASGQVAVLGREVAVSTLVLHLSYVVFLVASAYFLARRQSSGAESLSYVRRGPLARIPLPPLVDLPAVPLRRVSAPVIAYLGLGLGFVSGLLGVGGGIALMPILLFGFGFPIRQAAGTGILLLLVTALSGTIAHAREGHVHLGLSLLLLAGASVSARFGAQASSRLPARVLRRGLVVLILLTTIAVIWSLVRRIV
jgi:uncharacterized membrane protein YfcA